MKIRSSAMPAHLQADYGSVQLSHGLAVPNRSLTVRQIITMHHTALPPIQMMPNYPPDVVPNLNALDIEEVRVYRASVHSHIVDLQNLIKSRRATTASKVKESKLAARKAALDATAERLTYAQAAEKGIK